MNDLISSSLTMTSKEIAELTGKEHKNVLRDIDNLLKTLGSDLSRGFSMTYEGDPAHGYRIFHLDRDSTFCLMAGYDAVARMKIIKRWQALESGEAMPAFSPTGIPPYQQAATIVPIFVQAAKAFGFTGNQATLSANRAINKFTGINLLEAMGQTALASPDNQPLLTATDIAIRLGIGKRESNPLLVDCELQTAHRDHKNRLYYELTEQGQQYGVVMDTEKKSGGTPIRQIKWSATVLPILEARLQVESEHRGEAA